MSAIFTDTITVYNHYNAKWFATVLDGVQWTEKVEKVIDSDGIMQLTPYVTVTVPYRDGYVDHREYNGKGFTFGLDNLDVIVLGVCNKAITNTYSITDLQSEHRAVTISAVSDNTLRQRLKHWKVIAR